MLHRRKALLYLLRQATEPITHDKVQLLMFLFVQQGSSEHYQFIPTGQGPFSLVLEDDIMAMLKKGELTEEEQEGSPELILRIRSEHPDEKIIFDEDDSQALDRTLGEYQTMHIGKLLKLAVTMKPLYATHLTKKELSLLDEQTQSEIGRIRKTVQDAKRALYTIGYEKISLDEFMLLLLLHGIQTVIDVRETTTSRRREFSKHPLEQAFIKVGLDYISMPEVGIPSEIRNKILKDGDHQDLLVWYSKHVPQKSGEYAKQVATAVKAGNTALMCYEKDPKECHRTPFAQFCKETHPEITNIIHLRDFDEPYLDTFL